MKHERLLTLAVSVLLSFAAAFGAAGCLVSAFELPLEGSLAPVILAAALLGSVLLSFRHGGLVLLCLAALLWGYVYHDGRAAQQLSQLICHLTTIYDRAYGWGYLVLSEQAGDAAFFDWPVGLLGALTALAVSRCICLQTSVWLPVLVSLEALSKEMLVQILKEPKNAIIKQYQKLLAMDEVKLEFEDEALGLIAEKALEKHTGARALRAIIEEYMLDIMYEIPKDSNIGKVTITREYLENTGGPRIELRGQIVEALPGN